MKAEKVLLWSLILTVLDTIYLSWRFLALHEGWVEPGTGLCSWTEGIDCDQVLRTPEARAFYVPNAILGFGFFFGCLLWWLRGRKLAQAYQLNVIRALTFWLVIATFFTFYFWYLLLGLDWLCPFCPWNHLLTWIALGAAVVIWRRSAAESEQAAEPAPWGPLVTLVAICVGQFLLWQVSWMVLRGS